MEAAKALATLLQAGGQVAELSAALGVVPSAENSGAKTVDRLFEMVSTALKPKESLRERRLKLLLTMGMSALLCEIMQAQRSSQPNTSP